MAKRLLSNKVAKTNSDDVVFPHISHTNRISQITQKITSFKMKVPQDTSIKFKKSDGPQKTVRFDVEDYPEIAVPMEDFCKVYDGHAIDEELQQLPRISLEESLRKSLEYIATMPIHRERMNEQSTKHMVLEMNEFFFQMAEELRYLKGTITKKEPTDIKVESLPETYPYFGGSATLLKMFEKIRNNDVKVKEAVDEMQEVERQRKEIHQEIKSIIRETIESGRKIHERALPHYCARQDEGDNKTSEEQAKKAGAKSKPKDKKEYTKDFILRNIKLAKERTMSNAKYSLTDEEKLQIAELLSDIEKKATPDTGEYLQSFIERVDEYTLLESTRKNEIQEEITEPPVEIIENGFKLNRKDSGILEELNAKLHTVNVKNQTDDLDMKNIMCKDKPWRLQLMEKQLRGIDKNLTKIANEKSAEIAKSELNSDIELAGTVHIREQYLTMLEEIKTKIDGLVEDDDLKHTHEL